MDHVLRTRIDSLFSSLSIVYVDNQAVEIDGLEVILFPFRGNIFRFQSVIFIDFVVGETFVV